MGEKAKTLINQHIALGVVKRPDFKLEKFYSCDYKIFVRVLREEVLKQEKEIKQLDNYIDKLESMLRSIVGSNYEESKLKELENWFIDTKIGCENIE